MTIALGRVTKEENDLFDIMDDFFLVQCPFSKVSKIEIFYFYLWGHNRGRGKSMNLIRLVFLIL